MPNIFKRIISGIALLALTFFCMYKGQFFLWSWIVLLGSLVIDEVFVNFLKKNRTSFSYLTVQLINLFLCFSFPHWQTQGPWSSFILFFALGINILLSIYLFASKMESPVFTRLLNIFPPGVGLLIIPSILSLGCLIYHQKWYFYLWIFMIMVFGMDVGALFFGKTVGRRKLCPRVSPNKTIEGVVGGCFLAGLGGGLFWFIVKDEISLGRVLFFIFMALLVQIGDLVQSKIKRQYNLKDSSKLIPGHGGIYDRLDGAFFLVSFFMVSIMTGCF